MSSLSIIIVVSGILNVVSTSVEFLLKPLSLSQLFQILHDPPDSVPFSLGVLGLLAIPESKSC
jgi:hypothetical protein